MHIKRFVARDMKHAIRLVRDEQGPDAVILSNKQVPGGIEIIAAVDYDPRLIDHALGASPEEAPAIAANGTGTGTAQDNNTDMPERRSDGKSLRLPSPPQRQSASKQAAAKRPASSLASDAAPATRTTRRKAPATASSSSGSASTERTRRASTPKRKAASASKAAPKRRTATAAGSSKDGARRPAKRAASSTRTAGTAKRAAARPAAPPAEREILLPSEPPPAPAPSASARPSARGNFERQRDDEHSPRAASMTLWREGPEATVELSLVGEDDAPRRDFVDWDAPAPRYATDDSLAFDGDGDTVELDAYAEDSPNSFAQAMTAQQQYGASPPPFAPTPSPTITRQRYAEIEDEPEPTEHQEEQDEFGEEHVELSSAFADPAPSKGSGGLLSVLAGVARRPDRARAPSDPRPAPESGRQQTLRLYLRSLHRVGMSDPLVQDLAAAAAAEHDTIDWPALAGEASARLRTLDQEVIDRGGVVALVGPTGVGKTTSIAKLAARFALKHGRDRLALITTDTFRVGAHEQLNTFARILGVPLYQADDPKTFSGLMRRLARHRLVLIDTAGMGQRDLRLAEELSLLSRSRANVQVLLTLCANTERRTMIDTIERFAEVKPAGCVLTKMDEARAPGRPWMR